MKTAVWLSSLSLFGYGEFPCGCSLAWSRYRVGNLDVRECRTCGATWTERHRAEGKDRVIL